MKNELEKSLEQILRTITEEGEARSKELIDEVAEEIRKSPYKLDKPENFHIFVSGEIQRALYALAGNMYEETKDKDFQRIRFLYVHYGFMKRHIEELICKKEGSSCSADKSRYILNMYQNYCMTKDIPKHELKKNQYWKPRFGDNYLWMKYCTGLYELYHGKPDLYIEALGTLLQEEPVKFRYILHRWFMELKNGETIEVTHTWDEDDANPMEKMKEKDFYLVLWHHVQGMGFEEYEAKKGDYVMKSYMKVPETEVIRIYKKTEELYQ